MAGTTFNLISIGQKMLALAIILTGLTLFAFIVHKKPRTLKSFIIFAVLISFIYMIWRLFFTIPINNVIGFIFGVLLFLAEVFALIQSTTHRLMFMKDYEPEPKFLSDLKEPPHVDILIATYNEPVSLLKNTVAGAVSQHYPKDKFTVYVTAAVKKCANSQRNTARCGPLAKNMCTPRLAI